MKTEPQFVSALGCREELIPLYREYAQLLVRVEPLFTKSLSQQNYDREIEELERKYAPPDGQVYVVYVDGLLAGCVGMKRQSPEFAELKRLYVRPEFRGRGLGEQLTRRMMNEAERAGYRGMRLDTLPGLKSAADLYRRLGFREIEAYYDCLIPNTIFMEYRFVRDGE